MADEVDPVQILTDILAEDGPVPEDDVVRRLQAAGAVESADDFDYLLDDIGSPAAQLADERWVWLPTLLDGRVFTHRLNAIEIAHDVLTVSPDLDPVTTLCEGESPASFVDGSSARVAIPLFDHELLQELEIPQDLVDSEGVLLLAPGTLASLGAAEGDLVGLRLTARGLGVERVGAIVEAGETSVGAGLEAALIPDGPTFFNAAVYQLCADDPALFISPLAPLSETADAAGLQYDEDWLAPNGFDFDRWRFDLGSAALARRHALEDGDAVALNVLLRTCDLTASLIESAVDEEPPDGSSVGELGELSGQLGVVLADPRLAVIFITETLDLGRVGPAALGLFAETLEPKVPRAARVSCRWLRAVALERGGSVEEAERELLAAEAMDTDWGPALFDLARFAADRGDAERGLSLLRRAGAEPDDPLRRLLELHRASPRTDVGRNEPCWCGSGRKYKKCHLGREQLSLAARAGWLYAKATQHVVLGGWAELLSEVAYERSRYSPDDDADDDADDDDGDPDLSDPLFVDAVLFEGGALQDFLELRGFLLPDDERALADQWLLTERSVFEVDEVRRGHGVTVRDVRTGDRHEVSERTASRMLKPGQLMCARILPVGDGTLQFFGGLEPVALQEREPLIALLDAEPEPDELVAWLSRRFAPPTLVNTEGDPLTLCEATVPVGDAAGIEAALDQTYDRVEDEIPPSWLEYVPAQRNRTVRATLVLDGDQLRVETNSEKRMDAVLAALARIDPAMAVPDYTRRPIRDTRDIGKMADALPAGGGMALDPNDPQVAAMLAGIVEEYEAGWLDEQIPALNGLTPREAADDPTRRPDLIKLLASFPSGDAARGGMDADRLRSALGL